MCWLRGQSESSQSEILIKNLTLNYTFTKLHLKPDSFVIYESLTYALFLLYSSTFQTIECTFNSLDKI